MWERGKLEYLLDTFLALVVVSFLPFLFFSLNLRADFTEIGL